MALEKTYERMPWLPYKSVEGYFGTWESRIGYRLVLGGTRHHGYYKAGTKWPFPINAALRRMEDYLYDRLGLPEGADVLDAGCGVCHVALYLARKGVRVQGIDLVENHIHWALQEIKAQGMEDLVSARVADYHHLDHIPDNSLDGVFTMETFVHAHDGKRVLNEFLRILKPGGTLVMHEYWHVDFPDLPTDLPKDLRDSAERVNKLGAMPTNELLAKGVMQTWMKDQGFTDIDEADLTQNIRPMVLFFRVLGYIPYLIIRFLGLQAWFVNTEAGVQAYRGIQLGICGYSSYRAKKPLKNVAAEDGNEARLRRTG
ncbi:MAG: hypothetical protein L6R39_003415 [Caloplaca ligustica]|nr:MAG: hypothetical protein L6R39_003415 [Caloplaca ligustica]